MTTPDPHGHETASRAAEIVAGLPLADRIRLVSGRDFWNTAEIPGLVPSVMVTDGPHGLRKQAGSADHVGLADAVPATCFPVAATLASSWDTKLLEEVGTAIGREARAQDVAVLLGPGLNIKRHPRGGRNFEYFSEDPHLSGTLAAAMVRGIQSQGVGACPKHFAANNQETARMVVDTIVDERTLREIYLRGFEIVVSSAAPAALMTSYNQVNGQFASDHSHLLRDILRGEWGFIGLVMSDWGGTNNHVAGLAAGMDLEMPGGADAFGAAIGRAIVSGRLTAQELNRSAARVVELALRWQELRDDDVAAPDLDTHHALARRAAAAGTVLLTNDGLLPLPAAGSLAVIGAFAAEPRYQGAGSSRVNPTRLDTLLDSLRAQHPGELSYAPGYDPASGQTTPALLAEAATAAAGADRVVLLVGLPAALETEGRDRADWGLPPAMAQVLEAVLDANPRTAVVVVNGGAVDLPWADHPAALVEAYLGGQAGGAALADVLLGHAEPGGRLAESLPIDVAQLPADRNFAADNRQVAYREGLNVGYRFHDSWGVPARFPFGHGLSYTTFAWGEVEVTGSGTDLTVALDVTNSGERVGSEVVQVYVRDVESTVPRPAKELRGYAKVYLAPGQTRRVEVPLDRRAFAHWDTPAGAWVVEAGEFELLVAASAVDVRGTALVRVEADGAAPAPTPATPVPAPAGPVADDAEFAALLGRPVPVPAPVRPFTRNSTAADLASHPLGRPLLAALRRVMARQFSAADTEGIEDLVDALLAGMPLRSFVLMGAGISFPTLDRLIALLNADPRGLLRPPR